MALPRGRFHDCLNVYPTVIIFDFSGSFSGIQSGTQCVQQTVGFCWIVDWHWAIDWTVTSPFPCAYTCWSFSPCPSTSFSFLSTFNISLILNWNLLLNGCFENCKFENADAKVDIRNAFLCQCWVWHIMMLYNSKNQINKCVINEQTIDRNFPILNCHCHQLEMNIYPQRLDCIGLPLSWFEKKE